MILGILVLLTALSISAVAIYYSVSGLVAIFAAAALPIIIMGSALEIGKLVTAVWLHKYWRQASWWLKTYLAISVVILMFITSMGIFGFLSKAHIEQTAAAEEGVAQLERIEAELDRQDEIIARAEQRIKEAEASVGTGNTEIQAQIDTEQSRIDSAYDRIQPAIDEQNTIIQQARQGTDKRTEPYEQQLTALDNELQRLDQQAVQYEQRIATLEVDTSAVDPVLAQITSIQDSIIKVEGQLASRERDQIEAAQRSIGSNPDGEAGPNTRRSADAWITQQRARLTELQASVSELRTTAQATVDAERQRLTDLVASIRGEQTQAIKTRQLQVLATIDDVRNTEPSAITNARQEITRIRAGADAQIAQSNTLIQQLRDSLTVGKDAAVEAVVQQQTQTIIEANNSIDTLTQIKYTLQTEYRKLEAEVGPVKYLAEFIYGETDKDILEKAVRWVILIIIFVFDPLAVLLLIASQATFEMRREAKNHADKELHRQGREDYERARAQLIVNNPGYTEKTNNNEKLFESDNKPAAISDAKRSSRSSGTTANSTGKGSNINSIGGETKTNARYTKPRTSNDRGSTSDRLSDEQQQQRSRELESLEKNNVDYVNSKQLWKQNNPNDTIKYHKQRYIQGKIDKLPWMDNNDKD